ncbi:hypothetical protein ACP275_04G064000 [Erythranthe tilingii]
MWTDTTRRLMLSTRTDSGVPDDLINTVDPVFVGSYTKYSRAPFLVLTVTATVALFSQGMMLGSYLRFIFCTKHVFVGRNSYEPFIQQLLDSFLEIQIVFL